MKKTEILLVGTGAVGSFFGGKLAQANVRISTLCRSDFDIVKSNGIEIKSYKGDFSFKPDEVVKKAEELTATPDYILVCLKVLPEVIIRDIIGPAVKPETAIVLVQNGINIEQTVANDFPNNEIISGIAFVAARRLELGVVSHTGSGKLSLGTYPKGVSAKTEKLVAYFKEAGVPCDASPNIIKGRWQKMIWNAAFNPISVLGGKADSKQMVDTSESEELVRNVMKEVMAIAKATGHEISDEVMENAILGNRKMKPFKTSMLVDYENGRSMEIDAILGNAIQLAKQEGLSAPFLKSLFGLLKLHEATTKARIEN